MPLVVTAGYKFLPRTPAEIAADRGAWDALAAGDLLRGLVILAPEGFNGSFCGARDAVAGLKAAVEQSFGSVDWKDADVAAQPFRRWALVERPEIVTLDKAVDWSLRTAESYLSPAEWEAALAKGDALVLDTRNSYEIAIGKFKGAVDPGLTTFGEFPKYVAECGVPKDRTILMYCTGGIRCEKAALEMRAAGYEKVYQLEGGILRYLEELPDRSFDGECFVFDHRVAVDQNLRPTARYTLCPHCGYTADLDISCAFCTEPARICRSCGERPELVACSKNCSYHLEKGHLAKKTKKKTRRGGDTHPLGVWL